MGKIDPEKDDAGRFDEASAKPEARFIDLWHWKTCAALLPAVAELLRRFDLGSLLDVRALV